MGKIGIISKIVVELWNWIFSCSTESSSLGSSWDIKMGQVETLEPKDYYRNQDFQGLSLDFGHNYS